MHEDKKLIIKLIIFSKLKFLIKYKIINVTLDKINGPYFLKKPSFFIKHVS